VTLKDREDFFIEGCRKEFGLLTLESELLLRYGYSAGAAELGKAAYAEGTNDQRARVLDAIGAAPRKDRVLP
jgi:hypothetical protein